MLIAGPAQQRFEERADANWQLGQEPRKVHHQEDRGDPGLTRGFELGGYAVQTVRVLGLTELAFDVVALGHLLIALAFGSRCEAFGTGPSQGFADEADAKGFEFAAVVAF